MIEGDKVDNWRKSIQTEEKIKKLSCDADAGSVSAMHTLARIYAIGDYIIDKTQARMWYGRGANSEDDPLDTRHRELRSQYISACMVSYGKYLIGGYGGSVLSSHGIVYITRAAERGYGLAAYNLARFYFTGKFGLPRNMSQAKVWLLKAADYTWNGQWIHWPKRTKQVRKMIAQLEDMPLTQQQFLERFVQPRAESDMVTDTITESDTDTESNSDEDEDLDSYSDHDRDDDDDDDDEFGQESGLCYTAFTAPSTL